jgi:hypothetical protein
LTPTRAYLVKEDGASVDLYASFTAAQGRLTPETESSQFDHVAQSAGDLFAQ